MLKISEISLVLRTREFTDIVITFDEIYLVITSKKRSGSGVVDNTLDYQSRGRKIDPRFSGLSDETLNRGPVSV